MEYSEFKGKTAVATGGASGMGLLFLQKMAENGANVVLLDVNEEAMLQGRNRYERFLIYQKHVAYYPDWKQKTRFFSVPDIAHSSTVFYKNNIIQKWVFGEELPGGDK